MEVSVKFSEENRHSNFSRLPYSFAEFFAELRTIEAPNRPLGGILKAEGRIVAAAYYQRRVTASSNLSIKETS